MAAPARRPIWRNRMTDAPSALSPLAAAIASLGYPDSLIALEAVAVVAA